MMRRWRVLGGFALLHLNEEGVGQIFQSRPDDPAWINFPPPPLFSLEARPFVDGHSDFLSGEERCGLGENLGALRSEAGQNFSLQQ